MYYRNSDAAILVYDITNEESFNVLKLWHTELLNNVPDCLIIIVGNKTDLDGAAREVDRELVAQYAKEKNLQYFEASSKSGDNVNEIFTNLGNMLIQKFSTDTGKIGDN